MLKETEIGDGSFNNYTSLKNITGGERIDVTNAATNATEFKSDYHYWYKK